MSTYTINQTTSALQGFWYWTWSKQTHVPAGANTSIAFSGWCSPQKAIIDSQAIYPNLLGSKYICFGGGNQNGYWTVAALQSITDAINTNKLAAYQGIAYDIEEGDIGLTDYFDASFAAAKAKGLTVLVTVSHSAPYGIPDSAALMRSFFSNANIDILSPQLYTTGEETSNQYDISHGVAWSEYAKAKAIVAPSIVNANLYGSAQGYFANQGINLGGFIQWQQ